MHLQPSIHYEIPDNKLSSDNKNNNNKLLLSFINIITIITIVIITNLKDNFNVSGGLRISFKDR